MGSMENGTELGKLISKGSVVYIKHSNISEPCLSVVQNINDNSMYLNVPGSFLEQKLSIGANVSCQLLEGNFEYVIQGTVEDVRPGRPVLLSLSVQKVSKYKNNRVFKRYSVNFKAIVNMAGQENDIFALVRNISIIGAGIASKKYIHKDSIITLRVSTFISNDEALEFKAKVVRGSKNDNYYEYGLEIIEISDRNKDMLDKLIFSLNTNENIFIGDLLL